MECKLVQFSNSSTDLFPFALECGPCCFEFDSWFDELPFSTLRGCLRYPWIQWVEDLKQANPHNRRCSILDFLFSTQSPLQWKAKKLLDSCSQWIQNHSFFLETKLLFIYQQWLVFLSPWMFQHIDIFFRFLKVLCIDSVCLNSIAWIKVELWISSLVFNNIIPFIESII